MVRVLSENFLNGPSIIGHVFLAEMIDLANLRDRASILATIYSLDNYYYDILSRFAHLINDNIDFVKLLENYFKHTLPAKDELKLGIKREEEMKKLGNLIRSLDVSNENQTMVFHNFPISEIYDKKIVKASNFTSNRPKLINDFRSTITLNYDVVLPFHDKNYDPTSTDCTRSRMLPNFFSSPNYHSRFDTMPN